MAWKPQKVELVDNYNWQQVCLMSSNNLSVGHDATCYVNLLPAVALKHQVISQKGLLSEKGSAERKRVC